MTSSSRQTKAAKKTTKQKPGVKAKAKAAKAKPASSQKPGVKAKAKAAKAKPASSRAGGKKSSQKAKVRTSPVAQSVSPSSLANSARDALGGNGYAERFDRAPYEVPMMDLTEAIGLATELLEVKPTRPTPVIAEEIAQVERALARARVFQRIDDGEAVSASAEARPFDVAMDRAWATVVRRIQDHSELPVERHADAASASKVYAIVHDLSILKLNYLAEFAQIGARLDSLKREGLFDDARKLAGDAFIDEVLYCHGEYGKALGVMDDVQRLDVGQPVDRGETRLALIEAIREYAYQVLALARAGRSASWKQVEQALEPIAAIRQRQARDLRAHPPITKPAPHPPINAPSTPAS